MVAMETMHFSLSKNVYLSISGIPINDLAPMKNCPGELQGRANKLPRYLEINLLNVVSRIKQAICRVLHFHRE